MSYTLDPKAARRANGSLRITETGEYIGTIESVEDIESRKGTKGVNIIFVSEDGARADRLSLYTVKKDGTPIQGYDTLMALMTCCRIKTLKPVSGTVKAWDNEERKTVEKPTTVYAEFAGKKIGLLLQKEEYLKDDGGIGSSIRLHTPFDPEGRLTASEILDKKESGTLVDLLKKGLRDRTVNKPAPVVAPAAVSSDAVFEDDDIQF